MTSSAKMVIGSAEFHAERKTGIGASEAGAVLGVSPFKSAVDVWMEKTGRKPAFDGNAATYWGNRLEDLVASEYTVQTGRRVRRCNFTLRKGVMLCHVDRLVHDGEGLPAVGDDVRTSRALECKTARDMSLWPDGIPAIYEAQCFVEMAICPTLQVVDVAALFLADRKYEIYPLLRDDVVIADIESRLTEWWERHIVGDMPPDPVSEDDCKALWGRHKDEKAVFASADVEAALAQYQLYKRQEEAAKKGQEEMRLKIFSQMQDASVLKSADGLRMLASWKNNKDSVKTDWEQVARWLAQTWPGEFEPIIEKFSKPAPGARVFRPKDV